jgi:DNA-binding NtrC family response regulator
MNTKETKNIFPVDETARPEYHRVLVVDDEPAICFAYSKLLESESFNFDICENTATASSLLKENEYFAVISDVRFAGSDNEEGVHFVSEVRKEQPEAKVILITGHGNDELKKAALALGASHYFEKPVGPSMILSLLRKMHVIADEYEERKFLGSLQMPKTQPT